MPKVNPQKLIIILGPTASGKTELSLRLAKKFNGYIISADSRQIYKKMNIGTAKPAGKTKKQKLGIKDIKETYIIKGIPHYLINYIDPDQDFTLAAWQHLTNKLINSPILNSKHAIPMIVGGTGLYISSIVNNYQLPKGRTDKKLRNKLRNKNITDLLWQLKKLDKETYQHIDKKNKIKIVRALEYIINNNQPFFANQKKIPSPYKILQLGIQVPRDELYQRINKRVDKMIKAGLITEIKKLLKKYPPDLPPLTGIGYRQIISYLKGEITKKEAINLIKRDSRRYAKRQLTWFKRDQRIKWIKDSQTAETLIQNFLKK